LELPLIIWNTVLALFSLVGTMRTFEELNFVIRHRSLLDSVLYSPEAYQPAALWGLCFAVSKIIQLGDTMFIVLRKKPLTFLHWYHHSIVLVYVWHGSKCSALYSGETFVTEY
ncbi:hypothetical protein PMAYCL1PPCAC_16391, partial [Pristionchus mayeri]